MLKRQNDLNSEFDQAIRHALPYAIFARDKDRLVLTNLLASLAHSRQMNDPASFAKTLAVIDEQIRHIKVSSELSLDITNLEDYLMGTSESLRDLRYRVQLLETRMDVRFRETKKTTFSNKGSITNAVLTYLIPSENPLTGDDLAKATGLTHSQVRDCLSKQIARGLVISNMTTQPGGPNAPRLRRPIAEYTWIGPRD